MLLSPDMNAWREQATAKIDDHFNALALKSLHHDLARLAMEDPSPILLREKQRQELLDLISAARSPAEIEKVTASLL